MIISWGFQRGFPRVKYHYPQTRNYTRNDRHALESHHAIPSGRGAEVGAGGAAEVTMASVALKHFGF